VPVWFIRTIEGEAVSPGSLPKTTISRRSFMTFLGSMSFGAVLLLRSEPARAFYSMGAFWKKRGTTSGFSPCIGGAPVSTRAIGG
jgi:hypothetical protein